MSISTGVNPYPPDQEANVDEIWALFADADRLSRAGRAFHAEKHHLFYSAARTECVPRWVSERAHTTGDDVLSATRPLSASLHVQRGGLTRLLGTPAAA
jgi:hypothetical protein